jgi:transposase-like protein
MTSEMKPTTLQEAIRHYADEQVCIDTVARLRWPNGVECPACGHKEHYYLTTQKRWKCKECYKQFTVKLGTIFEDSPIKLDKWLAALWMLVNCKNGVSSYEIAKAIGITQKSAWFVLHRLRFALQTGSLAKLGGPDSAPVEVDETFIGGKARNMHVDKRERRITGTGGKDKAAVMGILERGGEVRAAVIPNRRKRVLQEAVRHHVAAGTALYTDALLSYDGLSSDYAHRVIDHAEKYVDGRIHTNGLENFWSLLKRGINGTYVSVEPFHLFRYLDEQAYRFNSRKLTDGERFSAAVSGIVGKRVMFKELTGDREWRLGQS